MSATAVVSLPAAGCSASPPSSDTTGSTSGATVSSGGATSLSELPPDTTGGDESTSRTTGREDEGESVGGSSSGGEPTDDLPEFPLSRDSSQISQIDAYTRSIAGMEVEVAFYRNEAYACGLEGVYTFVTVSPTNAPGPLPLWVYLRAGGGGYFDHDGVYHHGGEARTPVGNDEFSAAQLLDPFARAAAEDGQLRDTLVGRRLAEGYRFLMPAPCDHDVFSGVGQPYPRAPNRGTVDGLLATMAAVDYTRIHFATTEVTAYGTSAGSFGAFGLAFAYAREGELLRAAIMDSGLATPRNDDIFSMGCTLAQQYDPDLRFDLLKEKNGPFFSHPQLVPEGAIADGFDDVPLYVIAGGDDPRCCGPEMSVSDEHADNCSFVHGGVTDAIEATQPNPHRSVVVAGGGHVVTADEGPWVDDIDTWLGTVSGR